MDSRHCDAWRDALSAIDDDLVVWGRQYRRRAGVPIAAVADEDMTTDRDDVDAIVSGLMHGAQPPADAVTGEDVIPAWQPTNRGDRR